MGKIIKRGHTYTKMPDDAINVAMDVKVGSSNLLRGQQVYGYGYSAFVPQLGLVEDGDSGTKEYRKAWHNCLRDILKAVPKKSTVMVHTRFRNFIRSYVSNLPLPTATESENKWRAQNITLCEKREIRLYMHATHGEPDMMEVCARKIAIQKCKDAVNDAMAEIGQDKQNHKVKTKNR